MVRLLMMEGNPRANRERAHAAGIRTTGECYAEALRGVSPGLLIDTYYGADDDAALPAGRNLGDYAGFVVTGSSLHAYDSEPAVRRQIDMVRAAGEAGLPMLGSCWGLQIAAMAGGGMVARHAGRGELGIARKIVPNAEGAAHPLLAGRAGAFDAPCIHHDDVVRLPEGSVLLAGNGHCPVQAAAIPLGRSMMWGVQYHPEFDVPHLADLYTAYADDLVAGGFFADRAALAAHIAMLREAGEEGANSAAAWQLGLDADLLDGPRRRTELRNWLHHLGVAA